MKNALFFIIVLLIAGCSSTKRITDTETNVNTVAENREDIISKTNSEVAATVTTIEKIVESDSVIVTETIVELSKPDSTGKQYNERIINRVTEKGYKKQSDKANKSETIKAEFTNQLKTDKTTVKQDLNSETHSKTVIKAFAWWKLIVLAFVCVLGFMAYKYRKFLFRF